MRHLPLNEVAYRLAREVACVQCYQRPPGSESLGPEVPRACEPRCPLFANLPRLMSLAQEVGDRPGDYEDAVRNSVCGACHLRPTSGDFCADYGARTCPVSRYSGQVLDAFLRVVHHPGAGAAMG